LTGTGFGRDELAKKKVRAGGTLEKKGESGKEKGGEVELAKKENKQVERTVLLIHSSSIE